MNTPASLRYTREHGWARIEEDKVYIGITDYAQHMLGEIIFVELPLPGDEFAAGEAYGTIESVKAVCDLYCPLSGTVVAENENLLCFPELINEDPYQNWLVVLKMSNPEEIDDLLEASAYEAVCLEEEQAYEE